MDKKTSCIMRYFEVDALKLIKSGCGTDAPGSFIAWLCGESVVHAMEMLGKRYDIGNLESYEQVRRLYKG